jgi:hypothetical protein
VGCSAPFLSFFCHLIKKPRHSQKNIWRCEIFVINIASTMTTKMKNEIKTQIVKTSENCLGVVCDTVQLGNIDVYGQTVNLYGVRKNEDVILAYNSLKGDYLVPILFGSETNARYFQQARTLFSTCDPVYTWTIEIGGIVEIVRMSQYQFDKKYQHYFDSYNFSIINKGA